MPCYRNRVSRNFRVGVFVALMALPGYGVSGIYGQMSSASSGPPSSVSGEVVNALTNQPVARALVRFNDRAVLTNHDGHFEFPQNTESSGNFMVTKPGFSGASNPLDTPNIYLQGDQMAAPVRLMLYPEGLLTGTVLSRDGQPLQGIFVMVLRSVYDESGRHVMPVGQSQTDSHGNFRVPVSAGSYRIETQYMPRDRDTGFAVLPFRVPEKNSSNALDEIRVKAGEEQHFELRPAMGASHTVTMNSDGGSAQRGMGFTRITAVSAGGASLQLNPISNGVSGEMRIELPRGSYTLVARRNNPGEMAQAETTITVPDHDIDGIALRFSPVAPIPVDMQVDSDSTSDNSQAPSLTQLNLMLQNDQPDSIQADSTVRLTQFGNQTYGFVASPGSYHLQARGNGNWYVKSASAGTEDLLQQGLVVAAGSSGTPIRVTVSDQMGSLQGSVKLNGVVCSCWVYMIASGPSAQSTIAIHSNADGGYSNTHVPPGSYRVVAFERRHSFDFTDPAALASFGGHVSSVSVKAGEKASLDLNAVSSTESVP